MRLGDTVLRIEGGEEVLGAPASRAVSFGHMLGESAAMQRIYPLCERLAKSDLPVLIEGETGTGKEVLAEALHEASPRSGGPFVVFDCAAVPPNLIESALFGHERGAFTGATAARRGVFEEAQHGTLLLDEIGELEVHLQAKLLRALEKSEVQRVGSNRWTRVSVRVLAATRRDLDRAVAAGRFRDDLFFRLAVARVELPPLRHRVGDLRLLGEHFNGLLRGEAAPLALPADVLARFEDYAWPGNVRELHNAVARWVALGEVAELEATVGQVGDEPRRWSVPLEDLPYSTARQRALDEFERKYVERMMARHGQNVVRAAAAAGVARRYFQVVRARVLKGGKG
jgi:transcriptional regulator with GAF, ATPase, and Fis domain